MEDQNHEITLSDEDRLLNDSITPATNATRSANQGRRSHRNELMDSHRTQSMNDISRMPMHVSPFTFENPSIGAGPTSTMNGQQIGNAAGMHVASTMSSANALTGTPANANALMSAPGLSANAQLNDQHKNNTNVSNFVDGGAIPKGTTVTQQKLKASLRDVKRILDSNAEFGGAAPASTPNSGFRPKLNGQSTSNTSDGAPKKKKHRGGKKYKAMLAKRAEREKNEQNNTTVVENVNANMPARNRNNAPNNVNTNANLNNRRQVSQNSGASKRVRITGETPPEDLRINKKHIRTHVTSTPTTSATRPSVADIVIESNLVVAVYDSPAPGIIIPMDKVKYNKLYEAINNTLFSDIGNMSVIPTFCENKHVRGVMKATCSTPGSKLWLSDAIARITPLWPNMRLEVIEFSKLPRQIRVLGLFPNCTLNAEQIRTMLSAMNPHIAVGCWTILSSKKTDIGMHIAFGIDGLQLDMLSASHFRLHFGVGFANFKDISKKESEPQQSEAAGSGMDMRATDLDTDDDDNDDDVTITINTVTKGNGQAATANTNAQTTGAGDAVAQTAPIAPPNGTNANITPQIQEIPASDVNNSASAMETETSNQTGAT